MRDARVLEARVEGEAVATSKTFDWSKLVLVIRKELTTSHCNDGQDCPAGGDPALPCRVEDREKTPFELGGTCHRERCHGRLTSPQASSDVEQVLGIRAAARTRRKAVGA